MKQFIYIAAALFLMNITACNNEVEKPAGKGLIDPSIVHNPQSINGVDPKEAATLPVLTFADSSHNFGNATEGEKLTHDFSFTNTGKSPLTINGAKGSCGCTIANYPHEPVAPGKTGVLTAIFNTEGKQGHQEKTITVSANTARGTQLLFIQADIAASKN